MAGVGGPEGAASAPAPPNGLGFGEIVRADRQAHCECRTLARLARHSHLATHHARELARDGKAQPRAAEALRGRGIGLGEFFEQLRLLLRRHANAGVALCARRHGTCTRPASTAGLAGRFCRRGRGRLRGPFPEHALGMDRIGPCLALGYCGLPTQPCEHGDSVMSLWEMACSSSLSPLASFSCCRGRSTAGSSHVPYWLDCA